MFTLHPKLPPLWSILAVAIASGPLSAASLPYRYAWRDLGVVDAGYANDISNWGLDDEGRVVGLHRPLNTGHPFPPTDGGGYIFVDQNHNGFLDPDYSQNGVAFHEKRAVGVAAGQPGARVMDINEAGTVVGVVYDAVTTATHAALWKPDAAGNWPPEGGTFTTLPGNGVGGLTINNAGVVLDPLGRTLWNAQGAPTDLAVVFPQDAAAYPGQVLSLLSAFDLGVSGQLLVSVTRSDVSPSVTNFWIWTPGSAPIDLGIPAGAGGVLNSRGQAALLAIEPVEILPGVFASLPRTVVWNRATGEIIHLGVLLSGLDINDAGLVVGYEQQGSGAQAVYIPRVWDRQNGLQDLNALVSHPGGVTLTRACKVNNFGQIVALGTLSGQVHAFLLDPIEGLDRWWAAAGGSAADLNWTVPLVAPAQGAASALVRLRLTPSVGGSWTLPAGSGTLEIESNGWDAPRSISIDNGSWAPLGVASSGLYTFRIHALTPPVSAGSTRLQLDVQWGAGGTSQTSFLIADYPANDPALVSLAGSLAPVPICKFSSTDAQFPVNVQSTWGFPTSAFERNPTWAHGLPRTGDVEQHLDLSRYAIGAHASVDASNNPRTFSNWGDGSAIVVPTTYAATVNTPTAGAINYYFHYPRDDWAGANYHEGDWEGATIFLQRANEQAAWTPVALAVAQHIRLDYLDWWSDGGMIVPWSAVELEPGTQRPHVYVGQGGHASYVIAGTTCWPSVGSLGILENPELHDGSVKVTNANLVVLPRLAGIAPEDPTWEWLTYPGHWGLPLSTGLTSVNFDGPTGPVYQELVTNAYRWNVPVAQRWLDPWSWASVMSPLESPCSLFYDFETLAGWLLTGSVSTISDQAGNSIGQLSEGSDAAMSRPLAVGTSAGTNVTFNYRFVGPGDGDRLSFRINGVEQWSRLAPSAPTSAWELMPPVSLDAYQNQSVTMELRLVSAGSRGCVIWIDNLLVGTQVPPITTSVAPVSAQDVRLTASPNPARGIGAIGVELSGSGTFDVDVLDLAGRHVRTLARQRTRNVPGSPLHWDGRDDFGRPVAHGVYLIDCRQGAKHTRAKVVWLP